MSEKIYNAPIEIQKDILTAIGGDGTKHYNSPYDVQLAILEQVEGGSGGGIPEAPEDGKIYGRKDGDWAEIGSNFEVVVADELPEASADTMGKIYLIPSTNPQTQNVRDEFITVHTVVDDVDVYEWEKIGSTAIDLSDYYTKDETDDLLDEKEDKVDYIIFDFENPVWTQEQLDFINSNPTKEELLKRCLIKNSGAYYKVIFANSDLYISAFSQGIAFIFGLNNKPKVLDGEQAVYRYEYYTKGDVDSKLARKQDTLTAGEGITIDENNVISAAGDSAPIELVEGETLTQEQYDAIYDIYIKAFGGEPSQFNRIVLIKDGVRYNVTEYITSNTFFGTVMYIGSKAYFLYYHLSNVGSTISFTQVEIGGGGDETHEEVVATAFNYLNTKVDDNYDTLSGRFASEAAIAKNYTDAKALKAERDLDKSDSITAAGIYYSVKSEDDTVKNMITLTQAEYDALSDTDPKTFYIIVSE